MDKVYSINNFFTFASLANNVTSHVLNIAYERINSIIIKLKNNYFFEISNRNNFVKDFEYYWYQNCSLMNSAYKNAKIEDLKKIEFLKRNYLYKAAPIPVRQVRCIDSAITSHCQVNPHQNCANYYHRDIRYTMTTEIKNKLTQINEQLALSKTSPFIWTDTDKFSHLFPLKFTTLHNRNQGKWVDLIAKELEKNSNSFLGSGKEHLSRSLPLHFLVDTSSILYSSIYTNKDSEKEKVFSDEWKEFQNQFDIVIDKAIKKFKKDSNNTNLEDKMIKKFIKERTTCVYRVKEDQFTGLKVLPLFCKRVQLNRHTHPIYQFISEAGLFKGKISMTRSIINKEPGNKDVVYPVKGPKETIYFKRTEFMSFFTQFEKTLRSKEYQNKPHIRIPGQAVLNLLRGLLLNEINDDKWEQLHKDPLTTELIQASLFKIKHHLATAAWKIHDYKVFSQSMEIVHAEIATLLELTHPFQANDFSPILQENLKNTVAKSGGKLQCWLGKTATNTFAGINAAILQANKSSSVDNISRAYTDGFYYEQVELIGESNTIEHALQDRSNKKVDLYCCQFNLNIDVDSHRYHYKEPPVFEHIQKLLKKNGQHPLTVAVDGTIDFANSKRNLQLLEKFEKEIREGRLNFIFFRSGQKFDMFGTDNYYGSPTYMVNNGAEHWKYFNELQKQEACQTDSLSLQWFCLANKYASGLMDEYRHAYFKNTRNVLNSMPHRLTSHKRKSRNIRINTVSKKMLPSCIDIKVTGWFHKIRGLFYFLKLRLLFARNNSLFSWRWSFGFPHANGSIIPEKDNTSIRITTGINPRDGKIISQFILENLK